MRCINRQDIQRLILTAVLAGSLLLAGGCVYWRLSRLRAQLSEFDEHFAIRQGQRPCLVFRTPVLRPADLVWVTGYAPTAVRTQGEHVVWNYTLEKIDAPDSDRMTIRNHFREGRLAKIDFPARFSGYLTASNLQAVSGPLGDSAVAPGSPRTRAKWTHDLLRLPSREEWLNLLGAPASQRTTEDSTALSYRWRVVDARNRGAENRLRLALWIWQYNNRLKRAEIQAGRLRVVLDLSTPEKSLDIMRD